MFGFFKRNSPLKSVQPHRDIATARKTVGHRGLDHLAPLPTPVVTEGNDEADWSLWEDSVAFQDSQMPSPYPETRPVPLEAADAGNSVMSTAYDSLRGSDL